MKKLIVVLVLSIICLTGCGKIKDSDIVGSFQKSFDKCKGYQLSGQLEVVSNDDTYQYDVLVDYQKDDYYKVSLVNLANQFEQIILKNQDGVFLLTPSLNKSFKFQSDWPYKNSQIYLLNSLVQDIKNDSKYSIQRKDDSYVIKTKVDYPNNHKLTYQKIVIGKDYQLKQVQVYDNNDTMIMKFVVKNIEYSPKFQDDYFELDSIIEEDEEKQEEEVEKTSVIEDVLYPLIIPSGTKLVGEEKVSKDSGERVIMTYEGEKSFLLVEETLDVFQDFTVIPSMGEIIPLTNTIGVITDNSLSWSNGNMEYYLVSDVMSTEEMIDIAESIVGIPSVK